MGRTNRGSTALSTCVAPCSRTRASTAAALDASTDAATNRPPTTSCALAASIVRCDRPRSTSATTSRSKNRRRAAIRATASPNPPLPTTRMRTRPAFTGPEPLAPGVAEHLDRHDDHEGQDEHERVITLACGGMPRVADTYTNLGNVVYEPDVKLVTMKSSKLRLNASSAAAAIPG